MPTRTPDTPRGGRQPLTQRQAPDPRQTVQQGRPRREPRAGPVDAFADPGAPQPEISGDTQALLDVLGATPDILAGTAEVVDGIRDEQRERGYELGRIGEEIPDEKETQSKMEGWLKAKGEGEVFDFERTLRKELDFQADPETFKAQLDEITRQFTDGREESYLKGFIPQAEQVEHNIRREYIKQQQERTQTEGLRSLSKQFRHRMADMIQEGDYSPANVRKLWSEMQKKGQEFGLSKKETSQRLLQTTGQIAERTATPELMDVIHEGDKDGIKLTDTALAKEARTYEQRADAAYEDMVQSRQAEMEKKQTQAKEQLQRDITVALQGTTRPDREQLQELKRNILDNWTNPEDNELGVALPQSFIKTKLDNIHDMMTYDGFTTHSDPQLKTQLEGQILQSRTADDIHETLEVLHRSKNSLTPDDYMSLFKDAVGTQEELMDEASNQFKENFDRTVNSWLDTLRETGDAMFEMPGAADEATLKDRERTLWAENRLHQEVTAYKRQQGHYPDHDTLIKMQDRIGQKAENRVPYSGQQEQQARDRIRGRIDPETGGRVPEEDPNKLMDRLNALEAGEAAPEQERRTEEPPTTDPVMEGQEAPAEEVPEEVLQQALEFMSQGGDPDDLPPEIQQQLGRETGGLISRALNWAFGGGAYEAAGGPTPDEIGPESRQPDVSPEAVPAEPEEGHQIQREIGDEGPPEGGTILDRETE